MAYQTIDDVEIYQDIEFTRREWATQRVAWVVMGLLLLAAIGGLFGSGPLSHNAIEDDGGQLRLEYPRFIRMKAPATLLVELGEGVARDGEASVWLDAKYVEDLEIREVTPEPDEVERGPNRLIYRFLVADPGEPTNITFHITPDQGAY